MRHTTVLITMLALSGCTGIAARCPIDGSSVTVMSNGTPYVAASGDVRHVKTYCISSISATGEE